MASGSDWYGGGRGSAKERRQRIYGALVNRNTGEVRRPNQSKALGGAFKAGSGAEFQRRSDGKYRMRYNLTF